MHGGQGGKEEGDQHQHEGGPSCRHTPICRWGGGGKGGGGRLGMQWIVSVPKKWRRASVGMHGVKVARRRARGTSRTVGHPAVIFMFTGGWRKRRGVVD